MTVKRIVTSALALCALAGTAMADVTPAGDIVRIEDSQVSRFWQPTDGLSSISQACQSHPVAWNVCLTEFVDRNKDLFPFAREGREPTRDSDFYLIEATYLAPIIRGEGIPAALPEVTEVGSLTAWQQGVVEDMEIQSAIIRELLLGIGVDPDQGGLEDIQVALAQLRDRRVSYNDAPIRAAVAALETAIAELESSDGLTEAELAVIEAEVTTQLGTLPNDVAELRGFYEALEGRVGAVETAVETAQAGVNTNAALLATFGPRVELLEGTIADLGADVAGQGETIATNAARLEVLGPQVATALATQSEQGERIAAVEATLEGTGDRLTTVEETVGEHTGLIATNTANIAATDGRLTDVDERLTGEIEEVDARIAAAEEAAGVRALDVDGQLTGLNARLGEVEAVAGQPPLWWFVNALNPAAGEWYAENRVAGFISGLMVLCATVALFWLWRGVAIRRRFSKLNQAVFGDGTKGHGILPRLEVVEETKANKADVVALDARVAALEGRPAASVVAAE